MVLKDRIKTKISCVGSDYTIQFSEIDILFKLSC